MDIVTEKSINNINTTFDNLMAITHPRQKVCKMITSIENFLKNTDLDNLSDIKYDVNYQNKAGNTLLMYAATYGCVTLINLLLKVDVDINAKNIYGMSSLAYASTNNHPEIVSILLNHDASIRMRNIFGKTARDLAIFKKNEAIIEQLKIYHRSDDVLLLLLNLKASKHPLFINMPIELLEHIVQFPLI